MAQIKLKGNPINTNGVLPNVGSQAPDFKLTKSNLTDTSLADFKGKKVVLNIYPSIDTPVCATSTRIFNERISGNDDAVVVCVSRDLPFAFGRFCGAEGLSNVVTASELRDLNFGDAYGVRIVDGPMAGLLARAIVVIDGQGKIVHTELVPEIVQEPDYEKAMAAIS